MGAIKRRITRFLWELLSLCWRKADRTLTQDRRLRQGPGAGRPARGGLRAPGASPHRRAVAPRTRRRDVRGRTVHRCRDERAGLSGIVGTAETASARDLTTACSTDPSPAGARDAALVALLYGGGLRRSEAVALDLVDYEAETGQLTTRKSKGNRPRVCWVTNGSSLALADWLAVRGDEPGPFFMAVGKGGRVSQDRSSGRAVHVVLQRRARQAGVTRLTPQDLRRSFVSDLLERGADRTA
jgi:hypothetical protein